MFRENERILQSTPLTVPQTLIDELPLAEQAKELILHTRLLISNILQGTDDRILVIVGPCSIHDPKAALEYAQKLARYAKEFDQELCIVMRVYFEKPRTTLGWKGLINDPYLDATFQTNKGLYITRQLLLEINTLGMPTACEFLDTIVPQYISDLTSWAAIGARTTESQIHRELASGLPMPVGFKNATNGDIHTAIDAVFAASHPHRFLSITSSGKVASIATTGNPDSHIILRGSYQKPNYDKVSIQNSTHALKLRHLIPRLMVDCSHGNSGKNHQQQLVVLDSLVEQIAAGSPNICGIMLESNLIEGNQSLQTGKSLNYGQSITDPCLGWDDTVAGLTKLQKAVIRKRKISNGEINHPAELNSD